MPRSHEVTLLDVIQAVNAVQSSSQHLLPQCARKPTLLAPQRASHNCGDIRWTADALSAD